jgi:trigger factor
MNAKITKHSDTEVTFEVVVGEHEIQHALEHSYDHYRPKVKAAGFRPGKAPNNIVAREIGDKTIQAETLDHALSHAYSEAVAQEQLQPLGQPKIDIKKWVPYDTLEFEVTVEVVPPVKLADYKKIKKPAKEAKVEPTRIDEMVEDLRRRLAKRIPALRAAKLGDEVKLDFEGKRDGKKIEGATGTNYTLKLGSNTFIPGFEEELVGLKNGDEKTFTVTFPKDYHESSLAGQPVEFSVKLQEVTELELPKDDDAFAAQVGPFKTLDELRKDIGEQLQLEAEETAKRQYENELLDEIIAASEAKVPQQLTLQQLERLKSEFNERLSQNGLTMEQYLEAQKQTQEELEKQLQPEAEKRVKLALILSEVAKLEQLQVETAEIEEELQQLRLRYTDPEMLKELENERVREDIYNHLMATKTVGKLVEYAQT